MYTSDQNKSRIFNNSIMTKKGRYRKTFMTYLSSGCPEQIPLFVFAYPSRACYLAKAKPGKEKKRRRKKIERWLILIWRLKSFETDFCLFGFWIKKGGNQQINNTFSSSKRDRLRINWSLLIYKDLSLSLWHCLIFLYTHWTNINKQDYLAPSEETGLSHTCLSLSRSLSLSILGCGHISDVS